MYRFSVGGARIYVAVVVVEVPATTVARRGEFCAVYRSPPWVKTAGTATVYSPGGNLEIDCGPETDREKLSGPVMV
jgi:hypothetical protein